MVRAFKYPWRTSILAGAGVTQIGEFSYVLALLARQQGLIEDSVYNAILAASLITILLNAFLMKQLPRWLPDAGETHA
jgi:CPA2 family monovalent cation:H+ antiporter-2